jgi:hypothetical protein
MHRKLTVARSAYAPDAGVPDLLSADAGEVISAFDAGVADAPQADSGELAPDAGTPDAEQVSSADALLETAP